MVLSRKAPGYQDLPLDTKYFNQTYGHQQGSGRQGSGRQPTWGKNADSPYWDRERRPSHPQYDFSSGPRDLDMSQKDRPWLGAENMPREQQPFYDPNGRNVLNHNMPGDNAAMDTLGVGEGQHIWFRMAAVVRFRRIDLVAIMHGRDPKDRNTFEQTQFLAALADVFGPSWTEIAITNSEFEEITEPYKTKRPTAPGHPPAMIQYRNFCVDLQKYAEESLTDEDIAFAFAAKASQPKRTVTSLR